MILKQMTPLQQRLTLSGIVSLIVLVIIFLSQVPAFKPIFVLAIAGTIAVAMWELNNIARAKGLEPAEKIGITLGVLYAFATALSTQYAWARLLPELTLLFSLLSIFLYYFAKGVSPFMNLSATVFSIAYLAVPLSCMILIAYFGKQDGRWWLLYLVTVTKMTDTGGFFIGKQFGKQKLAPYISPKKTWEGALGGLACAIITAFVIKMIAVLFNGDFSISLWQSLWLGASIGIVAQCGDLAESLLKRDGGIKDSNQIPGLGGMLDVVDSLVFTAPLVYIFLKAYE